MATRYKWTMRADGTYKVKAVETAPKYDVTVTTVKPTVIRPKMGELPEAGQTIRFPSKWDDRYETAQFDGMADDKSDIMDITTEYGHNRSMRAFRTNWVKEV